MKMENENSKRATDKQKSYIRELLKNREGGMFSYIYADLDSLTMGQASRVIEALKDGAAPNNRTPEKASQELPITDKQKKYIKDIYEQNGIEFDEEQINSMTRREASELISSHTG
jgi:hypothetical protein